MSFDVASEVGQLRRVILHRPGLELSRLTPSNCEALLFDDVLWASRAREEHDAFASDLRERGVEVLYYAQMLGEALEDPEAREWAIERVLNERTVGPSLVEPLQRMSREADGATLARYWIGGVVREDISNHPGGPLIQLSDDRLPGAGDASGPTLGWGESLGSGPNDASSPEASGPNVSSGPDGVTSWPGGRTVVCCPFAVSVASPGVGSKGTQPTPLNQTSTHACAALLSTR